MRRRAPVAVLVALASVIALVAAGPASAKTTWLCRPGMADNPCDVGLKTTVFSPAGKQLRVISPKRVRRPKIDCFYVYPTVSDQTTVQANLNVDPVLRSIATFQAARYSQYCKVYAPVYRQLTIGGIGASPAEAAAAIKSAYGDVVASWRDYLKHFNHGRGVVLIGHSQGSGHLTQLIRTQIDPKRKLRKRLVSALILGGGLTVRKGHDVGGDFKHIRACRSARQLGCVIAYSTFDQPVPAGSRFGRGSGPFAAIFGQPTGPNIVPLCVNPGSLRGGSAMLDTIQPSTPFAPGAIAAAIGILGVTLPKATTPWEEFPGSYSGRCSHAGGAHVLQVEARGGAPAPNPSPDATWGLHLLDANIALGNLVRIVRSESIAYAKKRG